MYGVFIQFHSTEVLPSDQILINIDCKYGHFVVYFLLYLSDSFQVGFDEMLTYRAPSFFPSFLPIYLSNVLTCTRTCCFLFYCTCPFVIKNHSPFIFSLFQSYNEVFLISKIHFSLKLRTKDQNIQFALWSIFIFEIASHQIFLFYFLFTTSTLYSFYIFFHDNSPYVV